MSREYVLHDGKRGAALAVRVTPRATRNEIAGVLNDGTIKVHLSGEVTEEKLNAELIAFIAEVLGVPRTRVDVVAGETGRDKLISVLDMDVATAHQRIVAYMD